MKQSLSFLLLLVVLKMACIAQNEANFWYFGNKVGLNFNDGCLPTLVSDGQIDGFEGCATMSDRTSGDLLFYTNSAAVWNRNHVVMPNGNLVTNGNTITQVTIVPRPSYDSVYYVITSEIQSFSGEGLRAHCVDMALNGGLGGLVFKDSVLHQSPMTEKITAVRHANGTDIWILAHEYNSNHYLAFLLTASGINPNPVVSAIGKVHYSISTADAMGEMKLSPDGSKLATVTVVQPDIELFDFDNATGQVSNRVLILENGGADSIGNGAQIYTCSFSPNSNVLYVGKLIAGNSPCSLLQFDISSGDSATINGSRVEVFSSVTRNSYGLKIAPNGKIYRAQNGDSYLGVIHFPDSLGLACGYVDHGFPLNAASGWGLNNVMELQTYCAPVTVAQDIQAKVAMEISPNPVQNILRIKLPEGETYKAEIRDAMGKLVEKIDAASGTSTVNCSGLATGVYFMRAFDGEHVRCTKFIKE